MYFEAVKRYQAAFKQPSESGLGHPLVISNLNQWFLESEICVVQNCIRIQNPKWFFDADGFSVIPELSEALKRGMNACGVIQPSELNIVSVHPETQSIKYWLDSAESAQGFADFLLFLQSTLKIQHEDRKIVAVESRSFP